MIEAASQNLIERVQMKNILLMALMLGAGTYAGAADFSYKGVKLGDSMEVVKEKLPTYRCTAEMCDYSMKICVSKGDVLRDDGIRSRCDASASFGGAWVTNGTISFADGAVGRIHLGIVQRLLNDVSGALTVAYGPPTGESEKEMKNKAGATFPSWIKTWEAEGQTLELHQRLYDLDTGGVIIQSQAYSEAAKKKAADKAQQGSKDF